jgi:predicted RNase H-like HicB family nuclease
MHYKQLTATIHKEDDVYVSLCPELDITSQGDNIEEAKSNLKEAVELFCECASPEEAKQRSCWNPITESDLESFVLSQLMYADQSEVLNLENAKQYYLTLDKA